MVTNETSFANSTVQVCLSTVTYVERAPSKMFIHNAILVCIVNGILAISNVLVNSIVIVAFWKSPLLRAKPAFFLIMVLCVNDLSVGITVHPLYILTLVKQATGNGECTTKAVLMFFGTLLPGLSGLTLQVINIERYLAIVYPFLHQHHVTKTRLMAGILFLWSFWIPVPIVSFFSNKLQNYLIGSITGFGCLATIYVYAKIFQIARRKRRMAPQLSTYNDEDSITRLESTVTAMSTRRTKVSEFVKDMRLAKMFILIVVCSQVSYLPSVSFHIYYRVTKADMATEISLVLGTWIMAFITMNSVLNSLIFFWKNSQLRKEILRIVKCS